MAKKVSWPAIKFREKMPKAPADAFNSLGFGWELDYYDFLHRWNGGVPVADSFYVKDYDECQTVARIKYFYGLTDDFNDSRDLRHAVYHSWPHIPRESLPIASVQVGEDDWDLCMLLTFRWGDLYNQVYLLANPHDCGPFDPDDLSSLQFVSKSLPQFIKKLQPYGYYSYRVWFQLPASELSAVSEALRENDFEDYGSFDDFDSDYCAMSYHDDWKFGVALGKATATMNKIGAPKKVPKDSAVLVISALRAQHAEAYKRILALLKPLGLGKKLVRLGETENVPGY